MFKKISFILLLLIHVLSCRQPAGIFDIELTDATGKPVKIKEGTTATVIYFIAPDCPLCIGYTLKMKSVFEKYRPRNVAFAGISSGRFYSNAETEQFRKKYSIPFPVYFDRKKALCSRLNATVTPEVFLIDNKGLVRYSGKIDNWAISTGVHTQHTTEHYLTNALDELLDNRNISLKKTKAVGCYIE